MDKSLRNTLRGAVEGCRRLLEPAVAKLLEGQFGIHADGRSEAADRLTALPADDLAFRKNLGERLDHIRRKSHATAAGAVEQLTREVAFTHLNRLVAFKMLEQRKLIRETVSRGVGSNGFKFYLADHPDDERLASTGKQDVAYRRFLAWLGGTLAGEVGALFAPDDPADRLFPPQGVLDQVLDLINAEELKEVWGEDETLGWVYQYFTPKQQRENARKQSQAPRNSYELAFRNQFYTPRYVVEFLVDNTLGRTWYEMRKGETALRETCRYLVRRPGEVFLGPDEQPPAQEPPADGLSLEERLRRPVYIPHRDKKDPRELKILDPACGSGHFLLYCFDLLETIYAEAYDDPDLGPALRRDFATAADLRRAVPGLILEHNLHGIDIDLRAVQIAGLALWMRAQRSFQGLGLKRDDRPAIRRANVVVAEPMPGEEDMLAEFLGGLHGERLEGLLRRVVAGPQVTSAEALEVMADDLARLLRLVWKGMKLASEAGSLLRIDRELADAVAAGQKDLEKKYPLLRVTVLSLTRPTEEFQTRFTPRAQRTFWDVAEALVLAALEEYAHFAADGKQYRRRLFAEDAVQGFAFVDLCRRRYDVVLMNPPFGEASKPSKEYINDTYPRTKNDVYAAFVERGLQLLVPRGMLGAITSRTGFFLTSFQKWREEILLEEARPTVIADLGQGVLDTAMVETAAYCLESVR
jgi:hypothetical protein